MIQRLPERVAASTLHKRGRAADSAAMRISAGAKTDHTKRIEFESTFVFRWGFSLYLNGSKSSAKYQTGPNYPNGGEWVADTPRDIEDISLFWLRRNWDVGLVNKRVGKM